MSFFGGGRESVGEARKQTFFVLDMHNKKLVTFQKIVDFFPKK